MDLRICEEKTRQLMSEYVPDWAFKFDNAKRRFGYTNYKFKLISLSKSLCERNDWETVRLTVLHEIAHALVGVGHGHDCVWRQKCIEIGGDGKRCYDSKTVNTVPGKYKAVCPICGSIHYRHRNPSHQVSCGICCKTYDPTRILTFNKISQEIPLL